MKLVTAFLVLLVAMLSTAKPLDSQEQELESGQGPEPGQGPEQGQEQKTEEDMKTPDRQNRIDEVSAAAEKIVSDVTKTSKMLNTAAEEFVKMKDEATIKETRADANDDEIDLEILSISKESTDEGEKGDDNEDKTNTIAEEEGGENEDKVNTAAGEEGCDNEDEINTEEEEEVDDNEDEINTEEEEEVDDNEV